MKDGQIVNIMLKFTRKPTRYEYDYTDTTKMNLMAQEILGGIDVRLFYNQS